METRWPAGTIPCSRRKAIGGAAGMGAAFFALGRIQPAAAQTPAAATAAASSPAAIEVVAETAAGRVIAHAFGETTVPLAPRRVAALAQEAADSMLAMGVTPVAVSTYRGSGYASHLDDLLEGVTEIGFSDSPDLEAILAAEPDLIITDPYTVEASYGQLSAIAPTVVYADPEEADSLAVLRQTGLFLGLDEEAETRAAAFETKAAAARARLDETVGDETVLALRVFQRELRVEGMRGYTSPVLWEALDLTPHPLVLAMDNEWNQAISLELIPDLDADHIFLIPEIESAERTAELLSSPLWQNLPAVQSGAVHTVADWTHWLTVGVLANERAIEDVVAALAPA